MTESPSPIDPGANDPDQDEQEVWGDHIDPGAAPRSTWDDDDPDLTDEDRALLVEVHRLRTERRSESIDGLPDDLARILRDQSVVIPQHAVVFEAMAKYVNAESNTPSALHPEYVKGFTDGYAAGKKAV